MNTSMSLLYHEISIYCRLLLVLAVVALGATSLAVASPGETLLRLHGSNTIGAGLAPELVKKFLKHKGYRAISVEEGGEDNELTVVATKNGSLVNVELKNHGSSTAFSSLATGTCDIGMASRQINGSERQMLRKFGDMTSVASEHVLAIDAIAIIVHRDNPLGSLDLATLKKIFSGEIDNWRRLGGKQGPINVYALDVLSGTHDAFSTMVLDTTPLTKTAERFQANAALSDAVAEDPRGIGYVGMPYVRETKALKIKKHKDSIAYLPSVFSASYEEYPLSRRLYFYTTPNPTNPMVTEFVNFALSSRGQSNVGRLGFAKLSVDMESSGDYTDRFLEEKHKAIYARETIGGFRVNFNFRFTNEKTELENRSQKDLERFVSYVKKQEHFYYQPLLIGINGCYQAELLHETIVEKVGLDTFYVPPQKVCLDDVSDPAGRPLEPVVEVWLRTVDDGV